MSRRDRGLALLNLASLLSAQVPFAAALRAVAGGLSGRTAGHLSGAARRVESGTAPLEALQPLLHDLPVAVAEGAELPAQLRVVGGWLLREEILRARLRAVSVYPLVVAFATALAALMPLIAWSAFPPGHALSGGIAVPIASALVCLLAVLALLVALYAVLRGETPLWLRWLGNRSPWLATRRASLVESYRALRDPALGRRSLEGALEALGGSVEEQPLKSLTGLGLSPAGAAELVLAESSNQPEAVARLGARLRAEAERRAEAFPRLAGLALTAIVALGVLMHLLWFQSVGVGGIAGL